MEHGGSKVSGEGSLFVLLLNEEDSEETAGVEGKDRLRHKWKYKGEPTKNLRHVEFLQLVIGL